jgi:serine/threonine protein kinase
MHERSIFAAALEITDPSQRSAYLDKVCANDTELRQRIESLLSAQEKLGHFLTTSPGEHQKTVITDPLEERPGAVIGPYKLMDLIGEGGMGLVFVAEQEKPVRRKVALKVIKPGLDSAQIIARFEQERQALTMMDHVNIARVFDAGATEKGRPYYVMELVDGVPMTHFCDENKLTIRQRLELFATVCAAIQHAHQKGIIHRDIKPSNVLVAMHDGKPLAKVIDFGLAKAIQTPLTEHTQLTGFGVIVGTLEYMSPEQANFDTSGIDTRADVYSLGVILYELLTGTRPRDRGKRSDEGFYEMLQWIRETEPPRPSVRVAGLGPRLDRLAGIRQIEPAKMAKLLRGELDWIVMKALEKDRERRYETASGLANDVQRYLNDEPVEACPPAAMYQLGKFARKYRRLVEWAAFGVGLLVVGFVVLTVYSAKLNAALQETERAKNSSRKAEQLSRDVNYVLSQNVPALEGKQNELLHKALEGYKDFRSEPSDSRETRARVASMQHQAATLERLLGQRAEAEASYRDTIRRYEQLAEDFTDVEEYRDLLARCNFDLGTLYLADGKLPEAESVCRRAIALYGALSAGVPANAHYRRELADTYNNLGVLLREQNKLAKAEEAFRQAIVLGEKLVAEGKELLSYQARLAASYHNIGNAVRDQGDPKASLLWYTKAIQLLEPIKTLPVFAKHYLGNAFWDRANALGQLGEIDKAIEDWKQAIPRYALPQEEALRSFLAATVLEKELKTRPKHSAQQLYQFATVFARASGSAITTSEAGLHKQYTTRALDLLQKARTAGYFTDAAHFKEFKAERKFNPLRKDPAFRVFVQSLEVGKKAEGF